MNQTARHTFHIPVMGLAYTIDSPVKVAQFGIASVISIIEDRLIEMMRKHYYSFINETYHPITKKEDDYRAKRITDYLNLVQKIVHKQIESLRLAAFEPGSDIVKYFEMLPEDNKLKKMYKRLSGAVDNAEKKNIEDYLRTQIKAGSIDVNIMTKTDRNHFSKNGGLIEDGSDAVTALRGYVNSNLSNSSIVFSAGMNPRLFNYLERCTAFDSDESGNFKKKIIVKVSDYRSALIQSKYLAKKGIWVSEFRVESGLNCGGHAFATDGYLLGPILEEFKQKKQDLVTTVFELYRATMIRKNANVPAHPPAIQLSVQGGIGTAEEDRFLHHHYGVSSTGWGTPFLLVPEATTVDEETLKLLCKAKKEDVVLSQSSPLGVRFHYLKGTTSEKERMQRIQEGKPGSPCTEKHLAFNTEFTEQPICTASQKYQKLKVAQLRAMTLPESEFERQLSVILEKECLCVGLSNAAVISYKETFVKNLNGVTICPGPNIAYFSKTVSLQTMTDHIYGRTDILGDKERPHMFIAELRLYIDYLKQEISKESFEEEKNKKHFGSFCQNLLDGISYYRNLYSIASTNRVLFNQQLNDAEGQVTAIHGSIR